MATKSIEIKHGGRTLYRSFPDDAEVVTDPNGNGVVYVSDWGAGRVVGLAFAGNAARSSWHYRYKDRAQLDKKITEFFQGLAEHKQRVQSYRAEQYKPHTFKVGEIITNSWGYDQTNVDFYRITKTSAHYVWIKPVSGSLVNGEEGFMCGRSAPAVNVQGDDPSKWGFEDGSGPEEKHRAAGDHVSMQFGSGNRWDGKPMYTSWYA